MAGKPNLYAMVGMQHRLGGKAAAAAFVAKLTAATPMMLVRDPDNKFDRNAVQVWVLEVPDVPGSWRHIGFISKDQNAVLSRFIDQNGKPFVPPAQVEKMAKDSGAPNFDRVGLAVDARLHVGRNEYPLVEVV